MLAVGHLLELRVDGGVREDWAVEVYCVWVDAPVWEELVGLEVLPELLGYWGRVAGNEEEVWRGGRDGVPVEWRIGASAHARLDS